MRLSAMAPGGSDVTRNLFDTSFNFGFSLDDRHFLAHADSWGRDRTLGFFLAFSGWNLGCRYR